MSNFSQRIIYEDNHLLVVNKLPGELSQGDKSGDATIADLAKEYLRNTYEKKGNVYLGIPHRLDRPSSGLLALTRTEKALVRMNELFREGSAVKRIYWAVVDTLPNEPEGLVVQYISKNERQNKSIATREMRKKGKIAKLKYRIIGASKSFFLLEIELLTGRQHQIRAQLAAMGSHIKGDLKYGASRSNRGGGIHLHARSLSFIHPVAKTQLTLYAQAPRDQVWDYFSSLIPRGGESYVEIEE